MTKIADLKVARRTYGQEATIRMVLQDKARSMRGNAVIGYRFWFAPSGWSWAAPHGEGTVVRTDLVCLASNGQKLSSSSPGSEDVMAAGAGVVVGANAASGAKADTAQSQSAGSLKVGILPPAFLNATMPGTDEKETEIYNEIRQYIHYRPSFEVSFDYAARYGIRSSEIYAVWQGSVVKKVPDKTRLHAIGKELGVDILVLAWIAGGDRANATIDLYVFEVASGRMSHDKDGLTRLKGLVTSTFAKAKPAN